MQFSNQGRLGSNALRHRDAIGRKRLIDPKSFAKGAVTNQEISIRPRTWPYARLESETPAAMEGMEN